MVQYPTGVQITIQPCLILLFRSVLFNFYILYTLHTQIHHSPFILDFLPSILGWSITTCSLSVISYFSIFLWGCPNMLLVRLDSRLHSLWGCVGLNVPPSSAGLPFPTPRTYLIQLCISVPIYYFHPCLVSALLFTPEETLLYSKVTAR